MSEEEAKERTSSDVSTRYQETLDQVKAVTVHAGTTRRRMLSELLMTTLAMALTVASSIVTTIDSFGKLTKLSSSVFITISVAVGGTLFIGTAIYLIKRVSERRVHADKVRDAIESAYFRALEESALNPKPCYSRHAERTN